VYYNRKIAYHTLGCKLNFSETSSVAKVMEDAGYTKVAFEEVADFYVVNTCSVTENADKECKYIVRQILSRNPEAKVIIMGCYAQLKPESISSIPGVAMVLGANDKFKLDEHISLLEDSVEPIVFHTDYKTLQEFTPAFSAGDRTRTFLKVQDGCDYFCTFCTIPMARGKSRSATIAETIIEANKAAATGVKEIVVTGVNTGDFGKSFDGKKEREETFIDLMKELEKVEGVERWRISSIEPNLLTDEIIEWVSNSSKWMPHFHIPLQSGSDKILELMHRKYRTDLYQNKISTIRKLIPKACIGVDVIVGFPGETEEDFEETYSFLHGLDISYLHVFTYSERANTRALKIEPIVPVEVRRERNKRLRILSDKKKRAYYETFVGTARPTLFEHHNDNGFMAGYTDNYIRIRTPYDENLLNQSINFTIQKISPLGYAEGNV
jgi:threonylcarbamoyladenosine tRNA methylthiotransferase MtaB